MASESSRSPASGSRQNTLHVERISDSPAWSPPPNDQLHSPDGLMNLNNRSAPSLHGNNLPPQYSQVQPPEIAPLPPQFDPTAVLDQFTAMNIGGRPSQSLGQPSDPIPRSGSAMSFRSVQQPPHHHRLARPGIPPAPNHTLPSYQQYRMPPQDTVSVHSGHSRNSNPEGVYNAGDHDIVSLYSYDGDDNTSQNDGYQIGPGSQYQETPFHDLNVHRPPPNMYDNSMYNAASSIPGAAPGQRQGNYVVPDAQSSFPPSSHYSYDPSLSAGSESASLRSSTLDSRDAELRPTMNRLGTMASVNLRTERTKAVDLNAPPYTKEFIDQYRQRIKGDPDPESHFRYAKYLIDAAKRVGADAKDQRAVKKYRDLLITESLKVIRRLATQGQAYDEAQFFLANCYGTGTLGLQVDHERAYHLYLQAAKQNHAAACYRVAVCNEIGAGTRREPPRAAAFYRKAASLGDTAAMYKLGMILLHGSLGEQHNPREAVNWLKRAAEQADADNPHALHELGLLHEQPNSTLVPFDPAYARNLFTQAAHLGYTQSQYKLGQCFEYGTLTCPVDPRRSIAWYTKAAEKGDPEAELALSGWYLTGSEGVLKQSDSEAYLWARRAANKGLAKAEYAVGYYAEVGIGIKQDIEFAKRWYMRAAAQGNKRAMNRLTEMKRMGNKRVPIARPTRQEAKDECVIS